MSQEQAKQRLRQIIWERALAMKLIAPDHAWEVIGLTRSAWEEHEQRDAGCPAPWPLCEELRNKHNVLATPDVLARSSAQALLKALETRRVLGLASPRQVYFLKLNGWGDETTTKVEAGKILDREWRESAERHRQEAAAQAAEQPQEPLPEHDDWVQRLIDGGTGGKKPASPVRRFDFSLDEE